MRRKRNNIPHAAELIYNAYQMGSVYGELSLKLQPLIDEHECVILPIMNGGLWPFVRITERLAGDFVFDYVRTSRYDQERGGEFDVRKYPFEDTRGKMVILIDDIFDEGITMKMLVERLLEREKIEPGMFRTVCLFDKVHDRKVDYQPDFVGITVPDRYVFGCGMDYRGAHRQLPYVMALPD